MCFEGVFFWLVCACNYRPDFYCPARRCSQANCSCCSLDQIGSVWWVLFASGLCSLYQCPERISVTLLSRPSHTPIDALTPTEISTTVCMAYFVTLHGCLYITWSVCWPTLIVEPECVLCKHRATLIPAQPLCLLKRCKTSSMLARCWGHYTPHMCVFAENLSSRNALWTKIKLTSRSDELVLMFLNRKWKKLRFWVHPVVTRKRQQTECHALLQEFFRASFENINAANYKLLH